MGNRMPTNAMDNNEIVEGVIENDKVRTALEAIAAVMRGRSKEEACAIMCAVAASQGFYKEATMFADQAQKWREATCGG